MKRSLPIRGRGAGDDPPNRFDRLHVELDEEAEVEAADRETQYFRDPSRSVLTRNDSPDVPFEWSLNPYRGCEHGCTYCLVPETPVLFADLTWRPLWSVNAGDVLVGFDEFVVPGRTRKLRKSVVEDVWWALKPTVRIVTERTEVITTAEHRWLQARDFRWSQTHRLSVGDRLRYLPVSDREEEDDHFRIGYIGGISLAIARKREAIFGLMPATVPDAIVSIEPGAVREVLDIRTSTGTFYAAGLATHNCYARPTHEYLGYSAGLDFETRILAKEDAPELLRAALSKPSWRPTALAMSGVTDPYQPVERKLGITRRCLEVLDETRHPVTVITKSSAIERDVDILASLARSNLVHATLSITTLDRALQRAMEPRAGPPEHRLRAIRTLAKAGVPVSVGVAPVIPGLTEHEIPKILEAAAAAGATGAGMILLRLPGAVEGIFLDWLREHLPERFDRVVARLKEVRGGRLSDPRFGSRMTGEGLYSEQIRRLFQVTVRRLGLDRRSEPLSRDIFRPPKPPSRPSRRSGHAGSASDPQLDLLGEFGPSPDA